jgi:hypothetical protein
VGLAPVKEKEHMEKGPSVSKTPSTIMKLTLLVMLSAAVLLIVSSSAGADDVTWEDTVVSSEETYGDLNLTLDGNLTVASGGHLTLNDTQLLVNATVASQYKIVVQEGGTVVLNRVNISAAGGTFRFEVHGELNFTVGSVTDLEEEHSNPIIARGLVVYGNGSMNLTDTDILNPLGYAIVINDTGTVIMYGGSLYGASIALRINHQGMMGVWETNISADKGTELVMMSAAGLLLAENCMMSTDQVYSSAVQSVAVHMLGDSNDAALINCTITTPELAIVNGGYLEVMGSTFEPDRTRGAIPDLSVRDGTVILEDIDLAEMNAYDSAVELHDSTFAMGSVSNGSRIYSFGPVPPLETFTEDTVLHHHYWVDFLLLNRTGDPEAGLVLRVFNNAGGQVSDEMRSGDDGLLNKVAVRSWTIDNGVFTYEPSHRIEFGGTSYQISNLMIFDNTTVTLWDMVGSYDLALDTDSAFPSTPAPEENRTFDIIVDGEVLVPNTWSSGGTEISLFIDGVHYSTRTFSVTDRDDVVFADLDIEAGTYEISVVVDPDDDVMEMNEGGNNEVRFLIDVSPEGGTGDLVDLTAEIDRIGDTAGNSGEELLPGLIYVDYTVKAFNSKVLMRNVPVAVYINDAMDDLVRLDLTETEGDYFLASGQFRLNLPRGDYVIKVIVDPFDEISEEREHNNEDMLAVTLAEDITDPGFFDSTCCISLLVFGLVAAVGILGAWAQRKQRMAAEQAGTTTYQGTAPGQPYTAPPQTYGSTPQTYGSTPQTYGSSPPYPQYSSQPTTAEPVSLDERWRVEQSGPAAYTADGWEEGVADRITAPTKKAPPSRERYKATDLACPRCQGRDIMGFSDGSAKCQACKKIFYPGRRY